MLPSAATALAFAPTTETLACALGSEGLLLLDASSLHDLLSIPLSNGSIGATDATAPPFLPTALPAVGTGAGVIELRTAGGAWCRGAAHSSPVTSIDCRRAAEQRRVRPAPSSGTRTRAQLDPSASAQYGWASASCLKQWRSAAAARSATRRLGPTVRAHGGGAVVCAGADGALTLMGYPSTGEAPASIRYAEHKAPLRSACFSSDDQLLISLSETGELLQWRHHGGEPREETAESAAASAADEAAYDSDVERELSLASLPGGGGPGSAAAAGGTSWGEMAGAPAPARSRWRR